MKISNSVKKNKLPNEIKCTLCNKIMEKHRLGLFHQYYKCKNQRCLSVIGLPLNQYFDEELDEQDNDFGSGAYKEKGKDDD